MPRDKKSERNYDMKEIILLKEGEIALKGLNKRTFEEAFIKTLDTA